MGKPIKTIEDLKPDPQNLNRGTPRGHGVIEQSIRLHGAGRPGLAARDGTMIAGSQTLEEMAALGFEIVPVHTTGNQWPVHIRDDIEPGSEQARLMALEDNRASELGLDYDPALLAELAAETDLSQLFRDDELAEILASIDAPDVGGAGDDEGEEPDFDQPTEVQPGDVWRLGRHTIACLDSTDRTNIGRLAQGVTFVVADPPYGVDIVAADVPVGGGEKYDYPFGGVKNRQGLGSVGGAKPFGSKATRGSVEAANILPVGKYLPVIGDNSTDTAVDAALLALDLFPKATQFWWGANYYANALPPSSCWVVWDKENTGNFADAELAWSNHDSVVRIFKHMWNGMLRASERERRVHPTQKPQALFLWLYEKYGKDGDVVFDPFLGSGASLKAAERSGRTVVGFELSPHYCDHLLNWARAANLPCTRVEG